MSTTIKQVFSKRSNDYTPLEEKYARITGTSLFLNPFAPPPRVESKKPLTASVVIPAWNVRESILACLTAIERSSFNFNYGDRLQVIVVDDGSTDGTWEIIKKSRFSLNLIAVRQNHYGQAQALNTGISIAEGDIVISCDADMVVCHYTIEHFVARHQQLPNILLIGFRSNTAGNDPRVQSDFIQQQGSPLNTCFARDDRINFPISGWPRNMCLASEHLKRLGHARSLWMPDEDVWILPDLVFGALFSLSKSIYVSIGGYDERFRGWGCTDGFLAAKAIASGQYVIPIYAASGLHISHPPRGGNSQQLEYRKNRAHFFRFLKTCTVGNYPNWLAYAKDRIVESFSPKSPRKHSKSGQKDLNEQRSEDNFSDVDCLLAIGKFPQALTVLKNYQSKNKEWFLRLGKAFLGIGHYQGAIDILKKASASTNFLSESIIELAVALAASGQFVSAHKTLRQLPQIYPKNVSLSYWYFCSAQKHIRQGCKYLKQEFYDIALRCFEAALIADPNNRTALKYRDKCFDNL